MKIIVRPHSLVDLITNSSTEVFVCNRGHTLKQVQEIVEELSKVFYYSYYEPIEAIPVSDPWEIAYYGEGAILIEVDQYAIHPELAKILRLTLDTGERNEDAAY